MKRIRIFFRLLWHTRPGHTPAGFYDFGVRGVYCMACHRRLDR